MTARPILVPDSYPLPGDVVQPFDLTSGHAPLFGLSLQPDFYVDAAALDGSAKRGYDIAGGRPVWWSAPSVSVAADAGFANRNVLAFGDQQGDVRFLAPASVSSTILFVAAFDSLHYSASKRGVVLEVINERTDNSEDLYIQIYAPPITTNGGLQFSPDVGVNGNSVNMDGTYLPPSGSPAVFVVTFDASDGEINVYVNNTTSRATGTKTASSAQAETVWSLGSSLPLVGSSDPRGVKGRIACALGYPGVLSNVDLGDAIAALKARYGIA